VPYRLVYSRYPAAVATRSFRLIEEEIRAEQLPTLNQGLVERAAFRDIFEFAKTLDELTDSTTSGLERARENAHEFAKEVVDALNGKIGTDGAAILNLGDLPLRPTARNRKVGRQSSCKYFTFVKD
jgi:hypothetical protein